MSVLTANVSVVLAPLVKSANAATEANVSVTPPHVQVVVAMEQLVSAHPSQPSVEPVVAHVPHVTQQKQTPAPMATVAVVQVLRVQVLPNVSMENVIVGIRPSRKSKSTTQHMQVPRSKSLQDHKSLSPSHTVFHDHVAVAAPFNLQSETRRRDMVESPLVALTAASLTNAPHPHQALVTSPLRHQDRQAFTIFDGSKTSCLPV